MPEMAFEGALRQDGRILEVMRKLGWATIPPMKTIHELELEIERQSDPAFMSSEEVDTALFSPRDRLTRVLERRLAGKVPGSIGSKKLERQFANAVPVSTVDTDLVVSGT